MATKSQQIKTYFQAAVLGIALISLSVLAFVGIKYYFEYVYAPGTAVSADLSENKIVGQNLPQVRGLTIQEDASIYPDLVLNPVSEPLLSITTPTQTLILAPGAQSSQLDLPDLRINKLLSVLNADPLLVTDNALYWGRKQLWGSINRSLNDVVLSKQGELFMFVDDRELLLLGSNFRPQSVYEFPGKLLDPKFVAVKNQGRIIEMTDAGACYRLELTTKQLESRKCPPLSSIAGLNYVFDEDSDTTIVSMNGENIEIPGFKLLDAEEFANEYFLQVTNTNDRSRRILKLSKQNSRVTELSLPVNGVVQEIAQYGLDLLVIINTGDTEVVYKYLPGILPDSYTTRWQDITPAVCVATSCKINAIVN